MKKRTEYSSGGVISQTVEGEVEVLLIRIRKEAYELPKGHIETGESPEQAALRECIEEVGIESSLEVGEELGQIAYSFETDDMEIEKCVTYFRVCCNELIRYKKPKRTREVRWIRERELELLPLVNDELGPIIQKVFKDN